MMLKKEVATLYPRDLKYFKEHTWVRMEEDLAVVGITHYAQKSLGNVVFIDLPQLGTKVQAKTVFGSIESVKAVSDLYAPVSGTVVDRNEKLLDTPELVNSEPYTGGWMIKIALSNREELDSLLSSEEYQKLVGTA